MRKARRRTIASSCSRYSFYNLIELSLFYTLGCDWRPAMDENVASLLYNGNGHREGFCFVHCSHLWFDTGYEGRGHNGLSLSELTVGQRTSARPRARHNASRPELLRSSLPFVLPPQCSVCARQPVRRPQDVGRREGWYCAWEAITKWPRRTEGRGHGSLLSAWQGGG